MDERKCKNLTIILIILILCNNIYISVYFTYLCTGSVRDNFLIEKNIHRAVTFQKKVITTTMSILQLLLLYCYYYFYHYYTTSLTFIYSFRCSIRYYYCTIVGWGGKCGNNEVTCSLSGFGPEGKISFDWYATLMMVLVYTLYYMVLLILMIYILELCIILL